MLIDAHIHVFPDTIAARAVGGIAKTMQAVPYTDGTLRDTLRMLNEGGADGGVVLQIATKPSQQHTINKASAALMRDNPNILCFGTVHPDAPDALEELERCKQLGLCGIKLHPDYQNFFVDEPRLFPLYEKMEQLKLPVVFHAGLDPLSPQVVHAEPKAIAGVAKRFPNLRVVAAHMGGFMRQEETAMHLIGLPNVYFDTAVASVFLEPEWVHNFIRLHGAGRILFGSDSPWSNTRAEWAFLNRCRLTDRELDLIGGENLLRLVGVSPERFRRPVSARLAALR